MMRRLNPDIDQHSEYLKDLREAFVLFGYDKAPPDEKHKAAWELLKDFEIKPGEDFRTYRSLYSQINANIDIGKILGEYDDALGMKYRDIKEFLKPAPKESKSSEYDFRTEPDPKNYLSYVEEVNKQKRNFHNKKGVFDFPYPENLVLAAKGNVKAAILIFTSRLNHCLTANEKFEIYYKHYKKDEFQKSWLKFDKEATLPILLPSLSTINSLNLLGSGTLRKLFAEQGGDIEDLLTVAKRFAKNASGAGAGHYGFYRKDAEHKAPVDDFRDVDKKLKGEIEKLVNDNVDIYARLFDCLEKYGLKKEDKDGKDFYEKAKKAHRKYVVKEHPDKVMEAGAGPKTLQAADDKFKEMNLHFIIEEIIKNPRAREYYDNKWANRPSAGFGYGAGKR